jgi:hypothetical protein
LGGFYVLFGFWGFFWFFFGFFFWFFRFLVFFWFFLYLTRRESFYGFPVSRILLGASRL